MLESEILTESKTARDRCLTVVDDARAQGVLSKAKALLWASWQESAIATTEQVAEFYEVSNKTVQTSIGRNKSELEVDGLKTLKGKALTGILNLKIPEKTTVLTVWTPRATLRLGMLLRDSEVAVAVRTLILDLTEATGKLATQSEALAPEVIQQIENRFTELDQKITHLQGQGKQRFFVRTRDEALLYYSEECVDSFKSDLGGYFVDLKLIKSQQENPMLPPVPVEPEPADPNYNLNTDEDMKAFADRFYKERGVNWNKN